MALPYLINLNTNEITKEVMVEEDFYYFGHYGNLVGPKTLWYNGATYLTGYTDASANNSPVIIKYKDSFIEHAVVGQADNYDHLEHNHPALFIRNGFIYVCHVNGHGEDIKIWRSNIAESVTDGFTLHHTITGKFGYCNPRVLADGRVVILSRMTSSGATDTAQVFMISQPDDYTSWEVKITTESNYATDGIRHYPSMPKYYGTNNWFYFGITLRDQATLNNEVYYGHVFYKTQDFSTFYSLNEGFSKNIDSDGVFTKQEISDYLMVVNDYDDISNYAGHSVPLVLNDVLYNTYCDSINGIWKFQKIINGLITEYPCPVNVSTALRKASLIFIFYNGNNLVLRIQEPEVNINIYACNLDFSDFQFITPLKYDGEAQAANLGTLPDNLHEIEGEYIIGGTDTPDIFPYLITEDKFLI